MFDCSGCPYCSLDNCSRNNNDTEPSKVTIISDVMFEYPLFLRNNIFLFIHKKLESEKELGIDPFSTYSYISLKDYLHNSIQADPIIGAKWREYNIQQYQEYLDNVDNES